MLQVLIICMPFTSKVLLYLQEEVKVRWCQVRTVGRMVKCVPMEFIMQQGLSAWRYVGVHCHGSEQCHVRVCTSAAVLNIFTKTSKYSTVGISIDGCFAGHEINMGANVLYFPNSPRTSFQLKRCENSISCRICTRCRF